MKTLNVWAIAILVSFGIASARLLDGPDDVQSAQHQADELKDAQRNAFEAMKQNSASMHAKGPM